MSQEGLPECLDHLNWGHESKSPGGLIKMVALGPSGSVGLGWDLQLPAEAAAPLGTRFENHWSEPGNTTLVTVSKDASSYAPS